MTVDLPLAPPKILDQQRTAACRAIHAVEARQLPRERVNDLVRAATLDSEVRPLQVIEGKELAYWAPDTLTIGPGDIGELELLHHVAHHLTPRGFPAHGPEFVGVLVELVDSVAPHLSQQLRWALGYHDVSARPDGSAAQGKLRRWARRDPGCLVKVVLDSGERVVGLLESVDAAGVGLRVGGGFRIVPTQSVRYCARKT